jgi:membrane associated rhomboid family serine protease
MIPLRDKAPSGNFPFITILLIVMNLLVFLMEVFLGEPELRGLFDTYGAIPHRLQLAARGDLRQAAGFAVTILTSMFLHGGWLHLIGNMWYLWIFGDNVEGRLGHVRFLMFYLLCGGIACLAHSIVHVDSAVPLVGASGAIAGVLGAYLMTWPKAKVLTWVPVIVVGYFIEFPAIVLLGLWFLMQLLNETLALAGPAEVQSVAWMAHIGGFVAGMALVRLMRKGRW